MGYGLNLVRLPAGMNRADAYRAHTAHTEDAYRAHTERADGECEALLDPQELEAMDRLVNALKTQHPRLDLFEPNWSAMEDDERARRHWRRNRELREARLWVQIGLWPDGAGISLCALDTRALRLEAVRLVWDCLTILEREGGFTIYDTQIGKIVNLEHDFGAVARCAYGLNNAKR